MTIELNQFCQQKRKWSRRAKKSDSVACEKQRHSAQSSLHIRTFDIHFSGKCDS